MFLALVLLIAGLAIVIKAADFLIEGSSSVAKKYHISELVIGLTIVALGTSLPELVVNIFSAAIGASDIVFGNIIGSSIINTFLILGIAGTIRPLVVKDRTVWIEIPFMLFATIMLLVFASDGIMPGEKVTFFSKIDGIIFILLFILFGIYTIKTAKANPADKLDIEEVSINIEEVSINKAILFIIAGAIGLYFGGKLIVSNAIILAASAGISQKLIALTIISIGTSLPELATSIVASMKKSDDIAVGNIIGSNIMNIFLIIGVSSLINPIRYTSAFNIDMYVLILGTLLLLVMLFLDKEKRLSRKEAAVLIAIYAGYFTYLILQK